MSVAGLCGICERDQATYVCDRCGTPVCDAHYDKSIGLCTNCASEVRASRSEQRGEQNGDEDAWNR